MKKSLTEMDKATYIEALNKFKAAAMELSNVADNLGISPSSETTPDFLLDLDDFTYDVIQWVEDETEELTLTVSQNLLTEEAS